MSDLLSAVTGQRSLELRWGDVVELRSPAEILATLDEDGCLDGNPFMPEMLQYLGGRFTVAARVERACDTINGSGVRTMPNTVLLDDLRCDGSAHDGCQAGCRLYWREAWLRQVPADAAPAPAPQSTDDSRLRLEERIRRNTRRTREEDGRQVETYRCQATDFQRASKDLSWYDPGSFIREATCGNVGLLRWLLVTTQAALIVIGQRLGIRFPYPVQPRPQADVASARLDLKPGEVVRVRSKAEIEQTLDLTGKNRGLWFDREMLPYCGQTHTVTRRVERFIDESSGEMIEMKSDAIILDGVVCSGYRSENRWFCPRAIYPWWRECWLSRVDRS